MLESNKEIILYNAKIYTVDEKNPWAEAISFRDSKITGLGSTQEVLANADPASLSIDLKGQMVLPGFIESHAHPSWAGIELIYKVNLALKTTVEGYVEEIRRFVEANPSLSMVQGVGWSNTLFGTEGPSRKILDEISTELPIILVSSDHHSIWANTKAILLAGVDENTPVPIGGVIEKDGSGVIQGTFREAAQGLITQIIPDHTIEMYKHGLLAYQAKMAAYGITMAHDAMLEPFSNGLEAFAQLESDGQNLFKLRASLGTYEKTALRDVEKYRQIRDAYVNPHRSIRHVKIFMDGVVEGGTACLKDPYDNNPGFCGEAIWAEEELMEFCRQIDAMGYDLHFHVIGDGAVDSMLKVLESIQMKNPPRERRPIAAHVQILDRSDIPRLQKNQVVISANPFWFVKDAGYYYKIEIPMLGEERASKEYPMKVLFDNGLTVASASDYSVTALPAPLVGIQMGMNRCFPEMDAADEENILGIEERVSLAQMIQSYTINGAYANWMEDKTGSLEIGKDADLVVLAENLFNVHRNEISAVPITATIAEGRVIFGALPQ